MSLGIQPEDLAVKVKQLLRGNVTWEAQIGDNLFLDKAPDDASPTAYAVLQLTTENATILAGRNWIQKVDFSIGIFTAQPLDDNGRRTLGDAIHRTLCGDAADGAEMQGGAVWCGAAWPTAPKLVLAKDRREGVLPVQATYGFRVMVSGAF